MHLYCFYQCDVYTAIVSGHPYTVCMSNGLWSNPPPVCSGVYVVDIYLFAIACKFWLSFKIFCLNAGYCMPLVELRAQSFMDNADCIFKASPVGKVCTVKCKLGFEAVGNVNIQCIYSGRWSELAYQCLRKLYMLILLLFH